MRLVKADDGSVVCERCVVADRFWTRLKGLLGRKELPPGEGLLIVPTNSIHMFFMRFAIDAVFLDRESRVITVVPDLRPWRMATRRGAKSVLELPAGEAARHGLRAGEALRLEEEHAEERAER
jgi:uncharacterized protein